MNKSSIRKLMAASVLTTVLAVSSIQLVSARGSLNLSDSPIKTGSSIASKCNINLNTANQDCTKKQSTRNTEVKKTSNGNTDFKNQNTSCSNNSTKDKNTSCSNGSTTNNNTSNNNNNTSNNNNNTSNNNEMNNNNNNESSNSQTGTNNDSSINALEQEVIKLVNEERAKISLPALKANVELSKVARIKSQDMIDKNYFSHTSPTYGSPFDMMKKFGIKYTTAGENIASGYSTAKEVVDGWMNSPGHRANILNKSFTEIGVGLGKNSNGTCYWTQMFINQAK
ncbi:CAP domain-containing protein [Clostridium rectalis]|uniref:CAP domain-containing protein n=1 Tax=Clostridium rectalis TaxID=2040295 RepID=UPI000F6358A7|nr:CAP domain-containing protein [Clostridium rectalis]